MSKTLLNGVNEVLKKAKLIQGDSGSLSSLTDSGRQVWVDTAVQCWNEVVEELYSTTGKPYPQNLAEATITLVTNTRAYTLASDFNILKWPLLDETNGQYIHEYNGGYIALVNSQPIPADYTGLPIYAAIRPTDGYLYMDHIPTSSENGLIYKYRYLKDISVDAAADIFPFNDAVFRSLVPAVTELFNFYHRKEFSEGMFKSSLGRAARYLSNTAPMESYMQRSRGSRSGVAYPFEE